MGSSNLTMVGLGEILWDILPAGKQLGGAPANFAYHCASLGARGVPVSRIGDDEPGREAIEACERLGLDAGHIQKDDEHPTGTVEVSVDGDGLPAYTIVEGVAWDYIRWEPELRALAKHADVICFGSLAQRSKVSRETIWRFLECAGNNSKIVFDVNLRGDFYNAEIISRSMNLANVVKLNSDELDSVMELVNPGDKAGSWVSRDLLEAYNLELLCVTRGERGCIMMRGREVVEHPGYAVEVKDTVGAGDAFTAAMMTLYLKGSELQEIANGANRLGSYVAGQNGGTPAIEDGVREQVLSGSRD